MDFKKIFYYISLILPLHLILSLKSRLQHANLRDDSNFISTLRIEDHLITNSRYTLSDIFSSIKKINAQKTLFKSKELEQYAELIRKTLYDKLLFVIDEIEKRKNIFGINESIINQIRDLCVEQRKLFTANRTLRTSYQHLRNYNNYCSILAKADQIQKHLHDSIKDVPIEIGTVLLSQLSDEKRAIIETLVKINVLGAKANFCANMNIDVNFKSFIDEFIAFANLPERVSLREASEAYYGALSYAVIEIGKSLHTKAKKNIILNLVKDSSILIITSMSLLTLPYNNIYLSFMLLNAYSYMVGVTLLDQFKWGLLELVSRLMLATGICSLLSLSINVCHDYCIRRLRVFPIVFSITLVIMNILTVLWMC